MMRTGFRHIVLVIGWILLPFLLMGQGDPLPLDAYVSPAPTYLNQSAQIAISIPDETDTQNLYGLSFTLQLDSEWIELLEEAVGFGSIWGVDAITIVRKTSPTTLDVGVTRVDGQAITNSGVLFTLDITPNSLGMFDIRWQNVTAQDRDGNPIDVDIDDVTVEVADPNQRNVIFEVDVREQISNGMFNPSLNDTIYVLGTFADWVTPRYNMELVSGTLYRAQVPIIGDQGQVMEYKYQIITGDGRTIPDAGWEQSVGPGLNGNRILILGPIGTEQTLSPRYFSNVLPRSDLMEPSSEQTDVSLNPVFKWNSVDYVDSYEITVSTDPGLSNPIFLENLTDTVFQTSTSLEYNTIYYWAVNSSLDGIESPMSTIHSFTTVEETIFRPFVTVWNSTLPGETGSNQILIPGVGEYEIYWESSENVSVNGRISASGSHLLTLPQPGLYLIMITGDLETIRWPEQELPTDAGKWISINQWGDVRWSSMAYFADQAINLRIIATDAPDLQRVRNMERAFRGAERMNDPIGHWDVSGVEIATELFSHAFAFNQPLSDWDVSGMTDLSAMFVDAQSFDQNLGMWTISNASFMANMLDRSGMSTANYDATLIGWAGGSTVPRDITFGAEGLVYAVSETARQTLIDDFNWSFIGDSNGNLSRFVTFEVDVREQISNGMFNTALNDTIYVLGTFADWVTPRYNMELVSGTLYRAQVPIIGDQGQVIEYKFRIVSGDGRTLLDAGWEQSVGSGENGNRVLTLGAVGIDQTLDVRYFNNAIPVAVLSEPDVDQTDVSLNPQFKWNRVDHVESYEIRVSTDPGLTNPILSESVTDTAFQTSTPLSYNTVYYWTVISVLDGFQSTLAPIHSFTTISSPDSRVVTFQVDMSVQIQNGFFKPEVNDVVEVLGEFNNFEFGTNDLTLVSDFVFTTSFAVFGEADEALLYKFRVRPGDGRELLEGGWELTVGPGSDGQRELVLGAVDVDQLLPIRYFNNELPIPALAQPSDAAVDLPLTPQFSWDPVPHVDGYSIMMSTEATFSNPILNEVVTGTEFSPSDPLDVATSYFWTVRSNLDASVSEWATPRRFTTEDNPENPVVHIRFDGVVEDVSESSVSISLNSLLFTTDRFGNSGLAWLHQSNQDLKIIHNEVLPTNHLTISFWFNRSSNPTNDFENLLYKDGSFQTYMTDQQRLFTAFPTSTPGEWSVYGTPFLNLNLDRWYQYTFTFDRSTGAMTHYIDGDQVWQDIETNTDFYLKASNADLSIGRSGILNDHHARGGFDELRLYDRSLSSAEVKTLYNVESGSRTIPLNTPDLISPANNATGVSQEPVFRWSTVDDAESYSFQLSTDSGFNTFIIDMSVTDTLFPISGIELAKNTTHHWRVKAENSQGDSDWSEIRQFTTVSDVFRPFITTWKTDVLGLSGNNQLVIPGVGSGYQIQWVEVGNAGNVGSSTGNGTHILSFPTPGTYRVSISGPLESFGWIPSANEDDAPKLVSVDQWGDIEWTQLDWVMSGAATAQILATDTPNLSDATSIRGAFRSASTMNNPITDWTVSTVEDMRQLFENANRFNQPLFTWDVSNVELMDALFSNATDFNQSVGNWDVSDVQSMSSMFSGATSFNRPIGNWNVSSVTDMSNMFRNATAFNQYLGNWDIRNVTNMVGMLDQSGMSTLNYENTLIAWATGANTPHDITIGVGGLIYDFPGEAARATLINEFGWTFVGDSPFTIRPPSIAEPFVGQSDAPLQTTIRLNSVVGATAYDIQVSTSSDFSTLAFEVTLPSNELTTIFTAQSYTEYFVRARSKLNTIIGGWSEIVSFETELTPPVIQFPSLGQTNISTAPVLTWIPSSIRTQSEISVSTNPQFTDFIENQTVSTPSLALIDLVSGATYHWRVRSIDPSNSKLTSYVTGSFTTRPFVATVPVTTTITFPQSRTVSGYRMFGIPGTDSFPVKSVLTGIPQIEYRLFDDNGADVNYLVEFTNEDNWTFATGRGYWILSTKAIAISSSITNVTPDNADLFPVQLHSGWNIITNPLTDPVKWSDVQSINGIDWDLFGFDGSYSIVDTLKSFSGYYVNNSTGAPRQILIPFTPGDRRKASEPDRSKSDSDSRPFAELRIGFPTDEGSRLSLVRVDVGDESSIRIHPSLDFSAYGVVMQHENPSENRDVYHRQTIIEPLDQLVRTVRIENLANLSLDIRCERQGSAYSAGCALLDPVTGRVFHLDSDTETSLALPSGDYVWAVGSDEFLDSETEKLIPSTFQLADAYPNPFNPSTSIRFSIPDQGKTEVVVYDILGRQVATLLNSTLDRGWHLVSFDASRLSSGVYIIHVRSGAHQGVQKVTLMK